MFQKGDRVEVQEYSRTRTIFVNAEVTPGVTTTYKGGWTGVISGIFDGGVGGDVIEVLRDGFSEDSQSYYEFAPSELKKIS